MCIVLARRRHEGLSDKEIAARTATSHATTRTYVQRILRQLGVHDRRALIRRS
jgi:DNA-binding NarL/FixJ family response regulator